MNFKKLTLATAIAMAPAAGMAAMVEIEDSTLSGVTGQDGLEVVITTPAAGITGDIYLHDFDGLVGVNAGGTTSAYSFAGAIVIDNFAFIGNLNINIDAGDNVNAAAGTNPTLNVYVNIPSATIITGDIRVANSQRDDGSPGWGVNTMSSPLLSTMTIALSTLTMNIQLGNEPQGNMIGLNTTITSGLTISNFALNDAGGSITGGSLGALTTQIVGNGSANLAVVAGVNASTAGLVIEVGTLGSGTGMDIRVTDLYLGTTTAGIVGDLTLVGLNLNGTRVTISGK